MMYTPNQINYYDFQQFFQNYVYLFVFVPQIIINFTQWVYCTAVPLNLIVIDYVIQICVATGDLIYPHFMQYVEVLSADGMGGFFSVFCMHLFEDMIVNRSKPAVWFGWLVIIILFCQKKLLPNV